VSDEASDLSAAAAAAATEVAAGPPPAEPVADDPSQLDDDLPEGEDTFPREYVEKLRAEAAKHRTRARDIESSFDGYSPAEKTRFLELASQLSTDPEAAYTEFAAVTDRLATQLGKEKVTVESEETPEVAPVAAAIPALDPAPAALSAADIEQIVADRIEAERASTAEQDQVAKTFAEAEAIDPGYADPAAKAHLFAVAQTNGTDLVGAHEIITGKLNEVIEAAIEDYRAGLRSGKTHAPRLPAGDPSAGTEAKGPPKTLAEARASMEERLRATYGE
jgi:hypothetical protein